MKAPKPARRLFFALVALLLAAGYSAASGMLIPKDGSVPPLAIRSQRVDIQTKDGAATVKIEQVFINSVKRDLEAVYVFPLPVGASIADFAMYMNGKRVSGEIMEKDKARSMYEDIVRRMKDPGLLEHMSDNLFRASVYPVPAGGEQRIEISYSEALAFDSGLYRLEYPLKTGEKASATLEDFTVGARILSSVPIRTVYSPTHNIGISRKGDHEAVIGFEEDKSVLDRDFVLYYGVTKKEFGVNLLASREGKEAGYFMMLIAPPVEPPAGQVVRRDVVFVFDTSGSMAGKKIEQARNALTYCVTKLNEGDRFNIIRFSTDVELFKDSLVEVSDANRKDAAAFVGTIEARGGTDINGALNRALYQKQDGDRPFTVVFLTDGRPTIGITDQAEILRNVTKTCREGTRVFVFGVGNEVNTHLLDKISGEHGGVSAYVKPEEDIEVSVSSFQDKMSRPVLADPTVAIEGVETRQLQPAKPGDLFAGSQITLFGRYAGEGKAKITLTGTVNGKKQELSYDAVFPANNADNAFIPRLWATRRVGFLLDEIRLHGEDKELKDEVLKLSREFGILTPYTSYLVLEPGKEQVSRGGGGEPLPSAPAPLEGHWAAPSAGARPKAERSAGAPVFAAPGERDREVFRRALGGAYDASFADADGARASNMLRLDSGESAVAQSEALTRYKYADRVDERSVASFRTVGKKMFYLLNGVWTDRDYRPEMVERRVKYAGDEYFKLLKEHPELKSCFSLGERVIVCLDEKTAVIVEAGE